MLGPRVDLVAAGIGTAEPPRGALATRALVAGAASAGAAGRCARADGPVGVGPGVPGAGWGPVDFHVAGVVLSVGGHVVREAQMDGGGSCS